MSRAVPDQVELYRGAEGLPEELWRDLLTRDPAQAACAAGADYDDQGFTLRLLGRRYAIRPEGHKVVSLDDPQDKVDFQSGMVMLCALAGALQVPPAGRMITPQELPGGAMFFTGPHALASPLLETRYGRRPDDLWAAAQKMGAERVEGAGDLAFVLPGLPNLPMYVLFWAADDEFEARAVLGLDANARHHLALDGIWALCNLLVDRLCQEDPAA